MQTFLLKELTGLLKNWKIGSRRIQDGDVIMTHCNSHAALSIITTAFEAEKTSRYIHRKPSQMPGHTDNPASQRFRNSYNPDCRFRSALHMKDVDKVIVGADAIAANGALVNKIGTSRLPLPPMKPGKVLWSLPRPSSFARHYCRKPHRDRRKGRRRDHRPGNPEELPHVQVNPAFDFTPAEYIDMIVTDIGIIPPAMAYTVIKEHLGWELGEI